jgi:hypothetical protein
VRGREGNLR